MIAAAAIVLFVADCGLVLPPCLKLLVSVNCEQRGCYYAQRCAAAPLECSWLSSTSIQTQECQSLTLLSFRNKCAAAAAAARRRRRRRRRRRWERRRKQVQEKVPENRGVACIKLHLLIILKSCRFNCFPHFTLEPPQQAAVFSSLFG